MSTILIITVQEEIEKRFVNLLSSIYDVRCVRSEQEGVEFIRETKTDVAAVLIEIWIARNSGFAFAENMRNSSYFFNIPMIAVSDDLPVNEDMDCIENGFFDLINIYTPKELVYQRINNAIRAKGSLSFSELEKMLKALPACIFLKDVDGKYVFSTQYWHHLEQGDDPNWTIRGKTDLEIRKDKQNALKAMEADKKILETGEGTEYTIEENDDGVREFLQLIKQPVYNDAGEITGIIALINDVTRQELLKIELEKRAKADSLTGLLNKSATEELIRMMLGNYQKEGSICALLMLDVDLFKNINDTYGHAEGDRVLTIIGHIIRSSCRSRDVAGRFGGDEFMIFMRNIDSGESAVRLAERLQAKVGEAFEGEFLDNSVTLSIGISLYPEHGTRFNNLFSAADEALYEVKRHGRNACRLYSPDM